MALLHKCMRWCAHIVLDFADIVRDGDVSPVHPVWWGIILPSHLPQPYEGAQAGR